ncbi:hypothetical protein [Loktanella sp. R86503]|uniref:hypothetical protein n=1 Tax=Loktanella sp. R86503 TaxID=3093847 RepID=UPI0036D88014
MNEEKNPLRDRLDEADSILADMTGLASALEILAWDFAQESIKGVHARMRRDAICAISNAMGRLVGRDEAFAKEAAKASKSDVAA